jgi:hypothetical protein
VRLTATAGVAASGAGMWASVSGAHRLQRHLDVAGFLRCVAGPRGVPVRRRARADGSQPLSTAAAAAELRYKSDQTRPRIRIRSRIGFARARARIPRIRSRGSCPSRQPRASFVTRRWAAPSHRRVARPRPLPPTDLHRACSPLDPRSRCERATQHRRPNGTTTKLLTTLRDWFNTHSFYTLAWVWGRDEPRGAEQMEGSWGEWGFGWRV